MLERERRFIHRWQGASPFPDIATASANTFPTANDVEVVSFMPTRFIAGLIAHGQLNVHQISHKQIHASTRELRAEVEDLIINIRLEAVYSSHRSAPVHYIRPKYGFVHFLKPSGVLVDPNIWLQFGQLMIVYRDTVKQRTTYTYGDSHCRVMVETARIKHPSDPALLCDLVPPDAKHAHVPYVESQVWGAIDMADIAEFRVPSNRPELVESLKMAGLPIYTYDREKLESICEPTEESTVPIGRGNCLYKGDPKLLRRYDSIAAQRQIDVASQRLNREAAAKQAAKYVGAPIFPPRPFVNTEGMVRSLVA